MEARDRLLSLSARAVMAVFRREVAVYRRIYRVGILASLFDPLIYLLAMGFGLGLYVGGFEGRSYASYIAPGLVASAAMTAATAESTWNTFVRVHNEKIYEAMLATPASVDDIILGEALWAATRATIYSTAVLVVVLALGLAGGPLSLLILPAAFLGGYLFALLGLIYTSFLRNIDAVLFYYTLLVTPMFLVSGIFFPLDGLSPLVREGAKLLPLTHLVSLAQDLAWGTVGVSTLRDLVWLLAAAILLTPAPMLLFRRKLIR